MIIINESKTIQIHDLNDLLGKMYINKKETFNLKIRLLSLQISYFSFFSSIF